MRVKVKLFCYDNVRLRIFFVQSEVVGGKDMVKDGFQARSDFRVVLDGVGREDVYGVFPSQRLIKIQQLIVQFVVIEDLIRSSQFCYKSFVQYIQPAGVFSVFFTKSTREKSDRSAVSIEILFV